MTVKSLVVAMAILFYCVYSYGEEGNKGGSPQESSGKAQVVDGSKSKGEGANKVNKQRGELPTLIVFDMTPEKGVEKGAANLLTEVILSEINSLNHFNVIGQNDIDKMLFWETNKTLKNCNESSCMAQIAGAMGAEYYVISSIGIMGNNYLINMRWINVMSAKVENRISREVKKDENELVKGVKGMVRELFSEIIKEENKSGMAKEKSPKETDVKGGGGLKRGVIGYSMIVAGLCGILAGGYYTNEALDASDRYNRSASESEKIKEDIDSYNRISIIGYSVGGALITGGIIYLLIGSDGGKNQGDKGSGDIKIGNYYLGYEVRF
jgi:TolB-like protein